MFATGAAIPLCSYASEPVGDRLRVDRHVILKVRAQGVGFLGEEVAPLLIGIAVFGNQAPHKSFDYLTLGPSDVALATALVLTFNDPAEGCTRRRQRPAPSPSNR